MVKKSSLTSFLVISLALICALVFCVTFSEQENSKQSQAFEEVTEANLIESGFVSYLG